MAEELLTKSQVEAVVQFAQGIAMGERYGFWTPMLSNSFMQNLNNDAKVPTLENLRKALADYRNNADTLQSYMEYTSFWDMVFSRIIKSYANALAFDLQVTCENAYTKEDYDSEAYKADKKRIDQFLTKFNYKKEFRKIVEQLLLHEVYFVSFRKTKWGNKGMKFAIQTLPQDRCILDGYWENGMLFSMDLSYFLQAGTDLDLYDPSMKTAYLRVFGKDAKTIDYRPSVPLDDRTGVYAMYTQLSPNDGYYAFKFNESNFNTTPFLAPLLKNALTDDDVQQLQYNKDIAEAYGILAGEIGVFDNAKSGTIKNQMVFDPKVLGQFMGKAKAGLGSSVKLAALPVQNLHFYQYTDNNKEMYSTQLSTTAANGTGISRVIYSTDRLSNAEVEAALNEVYQTMKPLYQQFNSFMNLYGNQLTKKYKFRFNFDGSTYSFERNSRFENLMKLSDKGIVLNKSAYASALGLNPVDFEHSLAESKYSGWIDEFSQLMLNVNTSKDGSNSGRPREDATQLTDSGAASREDL